MKVSAKFRRVMTAADKRFLSLGLKNKKRRFEVLMWLAEGLIVVRQRTVKGNCLYGRNMAAKPNQPWSKVVRELERPWK